MTWKIHFNGKWDYRRLRRDYWKVAKRRPEFTYMRNKAIADGDKLVFQVMADVAEEEGFSVLANVLRTSMKLKKTKKRRKR